MTEIPNLCINLVRLYVEETSVDDILPFVRQSRNLNEITITHLEENALDLSSLNNERKKLNGVRKVMIYVSEDVYLATKWTTKDFNLDLIEMERIDSHVVKQAHRIRSDYPLFAYYIFD